MLPVVNATVGVDVGLKDVAVTVGRLRVRQPMPHRPVRRAAGEIPAPVSQKAKRVFSVAVSK